MGRGEARRHARRALHAVRSTGSTARSSSPSTRRRPASSSRTTTSPPTWPATPTRLIGFGSVDPSSPGALDELERMKDDLGLVGCKLGPIYQDVDPLGPEFLRVCEALERLELPMLIHQGTTFARSGSLLQARPILLDEIALRFPDAPDRDRAHGSPVVRARRSPWCGGTRTSTRTSRRWSAAAGCSTRRSSRRSSTASSTSCSSAPTSRSSPRAQTIEGLRSLAGHPFGRELPGIDAEVIEEIIHRPSLELLLGQR